MKFEECIDFRKLTAYNNVIGWARTTNDLGDRAIHSGVIDLTNGNPVFPPPKAVRTELKRIAKHLFVRGDRENGLENRIYLHQYQWPSLIHAELEKAIISRFERDGYIIEENKEQISLGYGVSHLTSVLFDICSRANRNVLLFAPIYGFHTSVPELTGTRVGLYPNQSLDGSEITPNQIREALQDMPEIDVLYLVNPNNPTGQVWSRQEAEEIGTIILEQRKINPNFIAIVDEIYRDLLFDFQEDFTSLGALKIDGENLFDKVITLRGLSKSHGAPRLRLGFAASHHSLNDILKFNSAMWQSTLAISDIIQRMALCILQSADDQYFSGVNLFYKSNLHFVQESIFAMNRVLKNRLSSDQEIISCSMPQSGFFALLKMAKFRGMRLPEGGVIDTDLDLMLYLKNVAKVALLPGCVAGIKAEQMMLRITFSSPRDILEEGLRRLQEGLVRILELQNIIP